MVKTSVQATQNYHQVCSWMQCTICARVFWWDLNCSGLHAWSMKQHSERRLWDAERKTEIQWWAEYSCIHVMYMHIHVAFTTPWHLKTLLYFTCVSYHIHRLTRPKSYSWQHQCRGLLGCSASATTQQPPLVYICRTCKHQTASTSSSLKKRLYHMELPTLVDVLSAVPQLRGSCRFDLPDGTPGMGVKVMRLVSKELRSLMLDVVQGSVLNLNGRDSCPVKEIALLQGTSLSRLRVVATSAPKGGFCVPWHKSGTRNYKDSTIFTPLWL